MISCHTRVVPNASTSSKTEQWALKMTSEGIIHKHRDPENSSIKRNYLVNDKRAESRSSSCWSYNIAKNSDEINNKVSSEVSDVIHSL